MNLEFAGVEIAADIASGSGESGTLPVLPTGLTSDGISNADPGPQGRRPRPTVST